MIISGIVAEYNPFHNGHAWHVAETRRLTACDYVVACMDGHFTQRGDAALFSKWNRARMALASGVDAVFELPALFAVRPADAFARGGAAILGGLGIDVLSFGCEIDDLEVLQRLADLRESEPTSVSEGVRAGLALGKSHARAWGEAASQYLGLPGEQLNQPNLILAVEYLRALRALGLSMRPMPVRRRGGYHDGALGAFASASAIRAALLRGDAAGALEGVPAASRPYCVAERLHEPDDLLLYRLRQMSVDALARLPDMSEGLEHRLYRLCRETGTRGELLDALKCKRYTRARLNRLLTHVLLQTDRALAAPDSRPGYARLLALRSGAEPLMRELSRRTSIPIVASAHALKDDPVFQFECAATDIWSLLHDEPEKKLPGREFREKFVRL